MPKGLVIFPTYNEAENIERIVEVCWLSRRSSMRW